MHLYGGIVCGSVIAYGGKKGTLDSLGLKLSAGIWTRVFCRISTCSLPLRHLFSPFVVLLMEMLSLTMIRTWSWSLMLYLGTKLSPKHKARRKIMCIFCEQAYSSSWVYSLPTELKKFVCKRVMGANTRRKFGFWYLSCWAKFLQSKLMGRKGRLY